MRSFTLPCFAFALALTASLVQGSLFAPPTLQPLSPWAPGNSYTSYGSFISKAPLTNSSFAAPAPSSVVVAVDQVNKVWFFGQYDSSGNLVQAQWALPSSAYILQGGACYPRANWNYDKQRVGFSYLAQYDSDLLNTTIHIAGEAYDIASCGCEEVAAMEMVQDLFGRGFALKSWYFAQAFNFVPGGVEGVLYFDRFILGQPDPTLIALPASCPTAGAPEYCSLFTPPTCTVLPNPTTFA